MLDVRKPRKNSVRICFKYWYPSLTSRLTSCFHCKPILPYLNPTCLKTVSAPMRLNRRRTEPYVGSG